MAKKVTLTMAQALVRFLGAQFVDIDGEHYPLFNGVFAIYGHGNVTGIGEALENGVESLPVYRAHNEQAMAHAAIAYAKSMRRRRMMICTTSIGPGATNMVTAAALAHVNRLPVLLLPGDTFANRLPDPVLQQVECSSDPTITANDCFKPVSRYWDRITRPEQILQSLPQAISILTDPADCGPVTLALPQDVQAESYDFPETFFARAIHCLPRFGPDSQQLESALSQIKASTRPLIVAGGGVHYSGAEAALSEFAVTHKVPVAETQAGKGSLPWDNELNVGSIGVTGSSAANSLAEDADLVIGIGTRLQDFTTGSGLVLGKPECPLLSVNVSRHDTVKRSAVSLRCDALKFLQTAEPLIPTWSADPTWVEKAARLTKDWNATVESVTADAGSPLPSDAEVIGTVNRRFSENATIVCAAGGLPGELHKLWRAVDRDSYHLEYGYSCMGYEIAGGIGVKMALPGRDVVVMVGDGSYLMLNSEIATSVALRQKLVIVVLDNRGFGCINRLQTSLGGRGYNNLFTSSYDEEDQAPPIDFAQHAASLGARAEKVANLAELDRALKRAIKSDRTYVAVIDTDPITSTDSGGAWWDVPVAEVSDSQSVVKASADYKKKQKER